MLKYLPRSVRRPLESTLTGSRTTDRWKDSVLWRGIFTSSVSDITHSLVLSMTGALGFRIGLPSDGVIKDSLLPCLLDCTSLLDLLKTTTGIFVDFPSIFFFSTTFEKLTTFPLLFEFKLSCDDVRLLLLRAFDRKAEGRGCWGFADWQIPRLSSDSLLEEASGRGMSVGLRTTSTSTSSNVFEDLTTVIGCENCFATETTTQSQEKYA